MNFLCTHFLVYFVLIKSAVASQSEDDYGFCTKLHLHVSQDEVCNYVKHDCVTESLIPYFEFYYCYINSWGVVTRVAYWIICVLLLGFIFKLLGSTAEHYFSPILVQISQEMGLPPRFAGALGNGAPDIMSSVTLVGRGLFRVAVGGLLGGGIFVSAAIVGMLIWTADGIKAKGALYRDVLFYLLSVSVVVFILKLGQIKWWHAMLLLLMYAAYVLSVLAADIFHKFSSRKRLLSEIENTLLENVVTNGPQVALPLDITFPNHEVRQGNILDKSKISMKAKGRAQIIVHPQLLIKEVKMHIDNTRVNLKPVIKAYDLLQMYIIGQVSIFERNEDTNEHFEPIVDNIHEGFSMHLGICTFWKSAEICFTLISKLVDIMELPFHLLRRATISQAQSESYSREWLLISSVVSPFILAYAFGIHPNAGSMLITSCISLFYFIFCFKFVKCETSSSWIIDSLYSFASVIIALVGFITSSYWISILAGELVSLLQFCGISLGIHPIVLGFTILAWGNSIGDLITNKAMVAKGLSNMAMTACFAGPTFNLLIAMSIGVFQNLSNSNANSIAISEMTLSPVYFAIMVNGTILLLLGRLQHGWVPYWCGIINIAIYLVFILTSLLSMLNFR